MLFKYIASLAVLASSAVAQTEYTGGYNAAFKNMTAVYWGQNAGAIVDPTKQSDLLTTCNNTNIDVVIVSFVTKFKGKAGLPILNLSNQCGNVFPYAENPKNDTDILNCPDIGEMITQCQGLGKKVLLSLGGSTYNNAAWKSVAEARDTGNTLWAMFGPPGNNPYKYRPFGNATVDGFDLDFEYVANAPFTDTFAAHMKAKYALDKKRQYLLTAAPQCPSPDGALDVALTKVAFDAIFVQFYNNLCQSSTWAKGKSQMKNTSFNFQLWENWARTSSANKNIKIFIGFLGGGVSGTTGYVNKNVAQQIIADSLKFKSFAGAMFWDASILGINTGILPAVRDVLTGKVVIKKREIEEREIKIPVGGSSIYAAEDYIEVKAPAEATRRFKRRHVHHRRAGFLSN
uniref:chitinase n=1 Tax=Orbilia oligospora TaxID=2813651 RepID=A0A2R4A6T3_ORBOL|nr:cuticle-degrading chitinase AO-379 [Orbilia oligospora]